MTNPQSTFRQRLSRLRTDERGMTLVFMSVAFLAFIAASMLAIDVGLFMTARSQAQRAADAGALAGATALVFNDFDDRTETGPAVTSAVNTAASNSIVNGAPSVKPEDVTFPANPDTGQNDLVEVTVYRSSAEGRANPIATLMARTFGLNTFNIAATARAQAAPAGGATCVLPLTIPDKWDENQTGEWSPDDSFNIYETQGSNQNQGAPIVPPDVYVPPGYPGATGYKPHVDKGTILTLKFNNDNKLAPSWYNAWDLPGNVGGDDYREDIADCNPHLAKIGDLMIPENGNMVGPTKQGGDDLIALDPDAYWDDGCKCVKGSNARQSPRIKTVPLFDPVLYAEGQHTGKAKPELKIVNYLGFFVEEVNAGGEVIGRITPITGKIVKGAPTPTGAFAAAIVLVK